MKELLEASEIDEKTISNRTSKAKIDAKELLGGVCGKEQK